MLLLKKTLAILSFTKRKFRKFSKENILLTAMLITSFATRFIYVFYFTDYKHYLVSDMGGYWYRALDRYYGNIFNITQWGSWATFFHYYLTEIFKILNLIHLFDFKLEAVLFLNIIYSTVSVYFFYLIATILIKDSHYSILATLFYAFSYLSIYFNALVMAENLSIPITIISVYLIMAFNNNKTVMFLAGLFFGVAAATKPAFGLFVIPFLFYIIQSKKFSFDLILNGASFVAGFLATVYLVIEENIYVSHGELKNLAAYGGAVFFVSQCKVQLVRSIYDGYVVDIGHPTFAAYPELARMVFLTHYPFHNQNYFYKLGIQCMRLNPNIWLDNFIYLKAFFWGCLFPSLLSARWFIFFINYQAT